MDEFGLVWLILVWFDEVDFLKCSRSVEFHELVISSCLPDFHDVY